MSYNYVDPRARDDIRAHEGDEVWVVLNYIKAEQHEAFEHFIHSILMPAVSHTHPDIYNKTRVLHPTEPNEDGTYTYIFIMDPVVSNGVYDVGNILYDYYPHDQAQEYMKIWEVSLAQPQHNYSLVQSEW
jgi:hypothetical protein